MQVTHATDHITHAVLGGKKAMNFGISDDPAFFEILSSALYKNPRLAMVRETICNAWDAHIDAGLTNKPINVTLNDDYLIIQDFGKGIPDALIAPIYGVYGASTKKNDGRQTGGFGLGCKSPFAYTDHFEVTSCHNGVKTIYNMSKSSAAIQGKPSITPIASFPTTETGITVKIPINPSKGPLTDYINSVIFNGDILANFNGEVLYTINLSSSEYGMVLLVRGTHQHIKTPINVRYGNVIYPVEQNEGYDVFYKRLHNLVERHYSCRVVLLAPPNSLSITPSREALTQSDITVETMNMLLGKAISVFARNRQMMARHKEFIDDYIDKAADVEMSVKDRVHVTDWLIPGVPESIDKQILDSSDDFIKLEILLRYAGKKQLQAKEWFTNIQRYFYKVNANGLFDIGMFQSWARMFQKNMKKMTKPNYNWQDYRISADGRVATKWWQRNVFTPLFLQLMENIPGFERHKLYFISPNSHINDSYNNNNKVMRLATATVISNHTLNLVHLLKPTVVLVHNAELFPRRLANRRNEDPIESIGTFAKGTYFLYEVSRKKGQVEEVKEAFNKLGNIEVLDFTGRFKYEEEAYQARQEVIAAERAAIAAGKPTKTKLLKKVKKGMVRLDELIQPGKQFLCTPRFSTLTDPQKIVDPEVVLHISTAEAYWHSTRNYEKDALFAIAKLYGDKIGVSNKRDFIERAIEKGAMELDDYLHTRLLHDIEHLPSMLPYHSSSIDKINNYVDEKVSWEYRTTIINFVKLLTEYPDLAFLAPNIHQLSDEDRYRWTLWQNCDQVYYGKQRQEVQNVRDRLQKIPLKKEICDFIDKLAKNDLINLLNLTELKNALRATQMDPIARAKVINLLTTILK